MSTTRYTSAAGILANAGFTEDPARLDLHLLTAAQRGLVRKSTLMGFRPVRVNWPDGTTALMPIPPGEDLPHPSEVIRAYNVAKASGTAWPKVVQA